MIAVAFVNVTSFVIFVDVFARIWTRAKSDGGESKATSREVKVLGGAFLTSFITSLIMAFWILSA